MQEGHVFVDSASSIVPDVGGKFLAVGEWRWGMKRKGRHSSFSTSREISDLGQDELMTTKVSWRLLHGSPDLDFNGMKTIQ